MIKAIFYKEWIKCQKLLLLLMFISAALVVYLFINNGNLLRTSGTVALWGQIAEGGYSLFPVYVKLFMPLSALAIAVMQYSQEMINKRFKLTLHLPHSESKIVGAMQLFGVLMVALIYTIILLPSYLCFSPYYTTELMSAMYISLVPYMLVGVACYFFSMWIVVEPIWRRRVAYLFIAIISLMPFVDDVMLGAMSSALPALLAVVGASVVGAYYSAARFKDGAQN